MQGRPLIMLALAGTLGLGAMLMTRSMLNKPPPAEVPMREVVVAVRDFNAEEVLKPDMVKTVKMAESAVPTGYFTSVNDLADRWVNTALLEGEPIVERKLGPKGSPAGLVAKIPRGMRAFAVEVNEQSGVSGFILPGHHVDVIKFENGDKTMIRGETILQNVQVLASGQVFVKSDEKTLQSRTVTLAVGPDDADMLVAAKANGMLTLSLRGVNDHDVVDRPQPVAAAVEEERNKRIELEKALAQLKKDHEDAEKELRQELEAKLKAREEAPPPDLEPVRVGFIHRGPGVKKEPFELTIGRIPRLPPEPSEPPPGAPEKSEDEPSPLPASLVQMGRAGTSRLIRP